MDVFKYFLTLCEGKQYYSGPTLLRYSEYLMLQKLKGRPRCHSVSWKTDIENQPFTSSAEAELSFNIFLRQVVFSLEVNFFIIISMILCDQCAQACLSYVFTADNVSSITQCKFSTLQNLLFQPSHCRNKRKSSFQRGQFRGDTVEVGILHFASNCLIKLFKASIYL